MYVIFTTGVGNDSGFSCETPILEEGFNLCIGIERSVTTQIGSSIPVHIVDSETSEYGMYYNGGWTGTLTP
jgi:hypothetical protein